MGCSVDTFRDGCQRDRTMDFGNGGGHSGGSIYSDLLFDFLDLVPCIRVKGTAVLELMRTGQYWKNHHGDGAALRAES